MSKAHGFIMDSTLPYKKRYWQVFSDKTRKNIQRLRKSQNQYYIANISTIQ